ncbi:type II toxin-antitoxin system HigB family toxin [Dyadobacter fermentans]|uniref:type II toxin-antitoxin system HigB family toxin n=1 Tax=Dyadobacter fermentans TaxID=94254 RepID=UPI001CBB69BB|nr:type II toxin-antitoxin system HigB family toxin [Dyadobacter fermentans]MBZ1359285.1 type II toxin-antitoxin system HigB family toxin [Dyadobacter fermentans]
MRVFVKGTLREFCEKYPDSEEYLMNWYEVAVRAEWRSPAEVKQVYCHASVLKDSRMVFNIKGNTYRLVVKFNFEKQRIFIRFVGRHQEYDKIDANLI